MYSAEEILEIAVKIELNGKEFYEDLEGKTEDKELKRLFGFLASQEDVHRLRFEDLKRYAESFVSPQEWEEIEPYLNAMVQSTFFLGDDKTLAKVKKVEDVREAIRLAIQFEKDTILFYYELLKLTNEEIKEIIEKIVQEEKKHVLMLSNV